MPAVQRKLAREMEICYGVSERRACLAFGFNRSTIRYRSIAGGIQLQAAAFITSTGRLEYQSQARIQAVQGGEPGIEEEATEAARIVSEEAGTSRSDLQKRIMEY